MFDVIIRQATIIDGTEGCTPRRMDLGVCDDRITAIATEISGEHAGEVIDADRYVLMPGFIDTHSHADLMLLARPTHREKVTQGVTTEILGQDGISYAPLSPQNLQEYCRYNAGLNGNPVLPLSWSSVGQYRQLYHCRTATNTVHLIGHGPIRFEAAGMRDVPLRGRELDRARGLLGEAMQEGAVGLSTGLSYFPQSWSDSQELIDLCEVVESYDGIFAIHLRTVFRGKRFDPVDEAIKVAERTGVKLHFSHFRTGASTAGEVDKRLEPLDEARKRGIDVSLDLYPYPEGSSLLLMLLPPWANERAPGRLMKRLSVEGDRKRIMQEIQTPGKATAGWDDIVLSHVPSCTNDWAVGKTVAEVAAKWDCAPEMAVCRLLLEEELEVGFWIAPPDAKTCEQLARDHLQILSRPYSMVGSDSIHVGQHPHPRAFGAFPRFFHYLRRYGGMSLVQMVNRMTANAADRFMLAKRGKVVRGMYADLVVLDPDQVMDEASYKEPRNPAKGVEHVMINGRFVVKNGSTTGETPGYAVAPDWCLSGDWA